MAWRAMGKTGLSIPFIVGSQRYLSNIPVHQNIEQLFADIVKTDGIQVYLTYCYIINDFILGELSNSSGPGRGFFPSFQNAPQSKLYVSSFLDLGTRVESISSELTDRLEYYIQQGQFSINEGERGCYSAFDLNFINHSFSSQSELFIPMLNDDGPPVEKELQTE